MKTATTKRADRGPRTTNPNPPGLPSLRVYHGPKRRATPDVPREKPSTTIWEIGGHQLAIRIWSYKQLMGMSLDEMPDPEHTQVQPGIGWIEIVAEAGMGGGR